MNSVVRSVLLLSVLSVLFITGADARPPARDTQEKQLSKFPASQLNRDRVTDTGHVLRSAATQDTTWLGYWTFDQGIGNCMAEGWTSVDNSFQDTYTHIDDFAGLGGGTYGRLVPIEGNQSLWCGARPDPNDLELCQYALLPGYGDSWFQTFTTTACHSVSGNVYTDFIITWDSEAGYDETKVQYSLCDNEWVTIRISTTWGGGLDHSGEREFFSVEAPDSVHDGVMQLRFLFTSDGAWSDQGGQFQSDGAFVIDSLTVRDAGGIVLPTELFETESPGDTETTSGSWAAGSRPSYGDFAALFNGVEVLQEDPCRSVISCVWGFFNGSTADYSCGGFPGQPTVPYVNTNNWYLSNEIWSPFVPISGTGTTFEIGFDVYRDLTIDALVFYMWHVRALVDGCPVRWEDRNFVHWGEEKDWFTHIETVGDLIPANATDVQLALAVMDMCGVWCGIFGNGGCHSHSPLFDNAWIRRISTQGPVWSVNDLELFQDSFAADGTTTGPVRIDMARDTLPIGAPNVRPGDSLVVELTDSENGLALDFHTGYGPAAYLYVGVWPQGQLGKSGTALSSDSFRWPVVDSLTHNGNTWYCVRMDSVFQNPGRQFPYDDRFCVDLNDNLFTPGDTICYVFCAQGAGPGAERTYYSRFTGTTSDLDYVLNNPMEMTCLPVTGPLTDRRILYVDANDGRGTQPFFDLAFEMLGLSGEVDRYDILGVDTKTENGPAARVTNIVSQVAANYHTIVWDSGDDSGNVLRDGGTLASQKVDDIAMLVTFLDNLPVPGGLYLAGNNLTWSWSSTNLPGAVDLRSRYLNFNFVVHDHTLVGLGVSPLVIGVDDGCFDHVTGNDTLVAFGGCPDRGYFDVVQATGDAVVEARYSGGGTTSEAIISQQTVNPLATTVGVLLSGFSFGAIRDADENQIPARAEHLRDIMVWLGNIAPTPSPATHPASVLSLAQNYPNPFNPTTTIEFTVRERAPVTLRIFNVAGQSVRTLVDDTRIPGVVHRAEWDGRNDSGHAVSSGVYFYRLTTADRVVTKKMVLLK